MTGEEDLKNLLILEHKSHLRLFFRSVEPLTDFWRKKPNSESWQDLRHPVDQHSLMPFMEISHLVPNS